jgi:AcrR family transcriptional regulator
MQHLTDKQENVLIAAQRLFGLHGYSGATIKMIAKEAGVSFGLVSHYFGNKEQLFLTAGFHMIDSLLDRVGATMLETDAGIDNIRKFIRGYFDVATDHPNRYLVIVRCSPYTPHEPDVDRSSIAEKFNEIIEELQYFLLRGIKDGSIRDDIMVEETALLIYATVVGTVRTQLVTPFQCDTLFEESIEFILRSIEAEPDRKPRNLPRRGMRR